MPNGLNQLACGSTEWIGGVADERDRVVDVDGDQCDHAEDDERDELHPQQELLRARRQLDPAPADPGHHDDPHHADDRRIEGAGCRAGQAEQLKAVDAGDLGEVGHHDDVGDDDRPAAHPAQRRAHRAGDPRERRAAVGVRAVHVVVGQRDAEHREEGDEHDRRARESDASGQRDEPEHRRERVGRGGRRDADHDVGDEADRVRLQPLLVGLARGRRRCPLALPLPPPSSWWRNARVSFGRPQCADQPKHVCSFVRIGQLSSVRHPFRPLVPVPGRR